MLDEPSSFLDVKQRMAIAKFIRLMLTQDNYVLVVEHDLAVLDYLRQPPPPPPPSSYSVAYWRAFGYPTSDAEVLLTPVTTTGSPP